MKLLVKLKLLNFKKETNGKFEKILFCYIIGVLGKGGGGKGQHE